MTKPVFPMVVQVAGHYNGPNGRSIGFCPVGKTIQLGAGAYLASLVRDGYVTPIEGADPIPQIQTGEANPGTPFTGDQDIPNASNGAGASATVVISPSPSPAPAPSPATAAPLDPPAIAVPTKFATDPDVKAKLEGITGIGATTADKLIAGGIVSLQHFASRNASDIADIVGTGVSLTKIASWLNEANTKLAGA